MKTSERTRADRRSVRQRARRLGCRGVPDEMICVVAAAADTAFVGSGRRWSGRQQPGWQGILFDGPIVAAGNLPRPGPVDFGHAAGKICPLEDESCSVVARVAVSQSAFRDQPAERGTPLFLGVVMGAVGVGEKPGALVTGRNGRPKTPIVPGNSARRLTRHPARPKAAASPSPAPRRPESDAGSDDDVSRRARPQPGPASAARPAPRHPGTWGCPARNMGNSPRRGGPPTQRTLASGRWPAGLADHATHPFQVNRERS
jgi:hypothetical protein